MAEHGKSTPAGVMSWPLLAVCVVSMIAAIGLALLLIEPLSLNAAIRGGLIAIGAVVFTQLGMRWYYRKRRRHDRT